MNYIFVGWRLKTKNHQFDSKNQVVIAMIIEQNNDRLTIQKKEISRFRVIGIWVVLILGISAIVLSFWISVPQVITGLSIFVVFIFLLIAPTKILEPRLFIFDRSTEELTVLYQIWVFEWKIEWKQVYLLQDIKDVILMTYTSSSHGSSYYTELIIRRGRDNDQLKDKRVRIPGEWKDLRATQAESVAVASFLGVYYRSETKLVHTID